MPDKLKILVVAPASSSASEEAIMAEYILSGAYSEIEFHHLEADFSPSADGGTPSFFQQLGKILSFRKSFSRMAKQVRPEVLIFVAHPHGTFAESASLLTARRLVPRTILYIHATGLAEWAEKLSGWAKKLFPKAFGQTDLVIVASKDAVREAEFLNAKSAAVISNGIPEAWEDGPRRERNHIPFLLYMGSVCEEKGVGVLIDACKNLRSRGYDFRCRIVGSSPLPWQLEALRKQAEELGDSIKFSAPVRGDAKWDLFAESDIFCYPTFDPSEPFGLDTIEAMMSGLPVVASNWRAFPEIVAEGKSGFLVPPRDPKALADRLAKLLKDPLLRQIMGNSGRNRYLSLYGLDVFQQTLERTLLEFAATFRSSGDPK